MFVPRLRLRDSSESLELRLVAAAPEDDPDGLGTADRLATFLDRTVAVSRPFHEPGAPPAAGGVARPVPRPGPPARRRGRGQSHTRSRGTAPRSASRRAGIAARGIP